MSPESNNSANKGIIIAVELLTSVLGVYSILTDKIGGLEEYNSVQKIGLCLSLLVVVFCIHLVLSNGTFVLELIGYLVLFLLTLFFASKLLGFSIIPNNQKDDNKYLGEWSLHGMGNDGQTAEFTKSQVGLIWSDPKKPESARHDFVKTGTNEYWLSSHRQKLMFTSDTTAIIILEAGKGNIELKKLR